MILAKVLERFVEQTPVTPPYSRYDSSGNPRAELL